MSIISQIITSIILFGFPLYFWLYIYSILGWESKWLRSKFFAWIFLGLFSVVLIFVLTKIFVNPDLRIFFIIWLILLLLSVFLVIFITYFSSKVSQKFLRKITLINSFLVFFVLLFFVVFSWIFLDKTQFFFVIITIFFAAFFEEIAKHFTMLALMGKYFSFSLRDITAFVFCIVLGFVFIENIFYLFKFGATFGTSVFRSIFSFSAHLVSAMLVVIFWWKSLNYKIGSFKYFFWFFIGLFSSVLSHFIYNFCLQYNYNFILILYLFSAYWLFVYALNKK